MYKKKCNKYTIFLLSLIIFASLTIIIIGIYIKQKNNKKNLIVGYIYRYSWATVRNYFISLVKAGFKNVDVVMFVSKVSQDTIEKIKSYGVIIYPMPDNPYLSKNCQRWEIYANFLKENKDKYKIVLHTDVRDTIFQKDVFQFYNSYKSFFGVSEEDVLLNETINKHWMLTIINKSLFNNYFASRAVICAGLVIGTPDKFIEYNNSFIKMAKGKYFGDQRYINYLIYYEKLFNDSIIIKNNSNTHLMNIAMTKRDRITLDENDNILNYNGEIASVVHQYDRHRDIVKKMNRKYNDINFNYTAFKEEQLKKEILERNETIKFGFIIFIVFIITVISTKYIIKELRNYFLKKNNKLIKVKIKHNLKKKNSKK